MLIVYKNIKKLLIKKSKRKNMLICQTELKNYHHLQFQIKDQNLHFCINMTNLDINEINLIVYKIFI